ncbi:hypothetical protein CGRA01v4_06461 [Colletotrichum graminicola]|nr:hypothetical protein CGRA01v4_06461 [Colletotrichum graminicola]
MHIEFIPTPTSSPKQILKPCPLPTPLSSRSNSYSHHTTVPPPASLPILLLTEANRLIDSPILRHASPHDCHSSLPPTRHSRIGPTGSRPTACAFHFAYRGLCASVTSQTQRRRTDRADHGRRRCTNNRPSPLELSLMNSFSNAVA